MSVIDFELYQHEASRTLARGEQGEKGRAAMKPHVCPLCRAAPAQLDLSAVMFLKPQNKRAAILRLIREVATGLTVAELTKVLKISHASVSARVHDLQRANEIRKCGKRATDSGRLAWCWVPIDAAAADTEQLQPTSAEGAPA